MKRPCLDCGRPTEGSRCAEHVTAHERRRDLEATRRRRGQGGRPQYGGAHRKEGGRVRAQARECWICGAGPRDNDPWQADHIIPVAAKQGGGGGLAAAHRSCNIGRANQLRAGKPDVALERLMKRRRGGEEASRTQPDDAARADTTTPPPSAEQTRKRQTP